MSKSVKKEILASEYSSKQVLAVNTSMYVLRNPIEHKALKAPKGLNEANISHIRPNITFYIIICNVYQIERLIGT